MSASQSLMTEWQAMGKDSHFYLQISTQHNDCEQCYWRKILSFLSSSFRLSFSGFSLSPSVIFHNLIIFIFSGDGEDETVSHILLQELFDLVIFLPPYVQTLQIDKFSLQLRKSTVKPTFAQSVRCIFILWFLMTSDDPVPPLSPVTELNQQNDVRFFKVTLEQLGPQPCWKEEEDRMGGEDSSDYKGCLGPETYDNITQIMGQKATGEEGYIYITVRCR